MYRPGPVVLSVVMVLSVLCAAAAQGLLPTGPGVLPYEPDLRSGMGFSGKFCRATHGDGGLIISALTKDEPCMFKPDSNRVLSTSFRVEASQRLRQGPQDEHFGIFFGDRNDTNRRSYLTATMTNTGVAALEYFDGAKWTRIAAANPAPKPRLVPGAINRLAIEVRDKEVRAFLNGELLAAGVSPVAVDGHVGLYVNAVGQEAVYSEFRIASLAPVTTMTIEKVTPPDTRMLPGGNVFVDDDLTTQQRFLVASDQFCTTAYADGGLRVAGGPTGCEYEAHYLTEAPMTARFEVSTRLLKGDTVGLIFGKSKRADGLHYHFMVSATGQFVLEISQNRSSKALIDWTPSTAVRTTPGATNRLAVEVSGQDLRCFINGQYVGQASSPQPVQGGYGFIVLENANSAVFSNLKIVDFASPGGAAKEGGARRALAASGQGTSATAEQRGGESRGQRKP